MDAQTIDDKATARSTTRQVADSAHNVIEAAANKAEKAEREVRERASAAGDKVEATQAAATQSMETALKRTEKFVKEQPLTAAGIAFAAGVVASALLRR